MPAKYITMVILFIFIIILLFTSCRTTSGFPVKDEELHTAWAAWSSGEFE